MSFIGRMLMEEESLGIVETIITLAQKLKMDAIAEGIETEEQAQKLKELRCIYGQGYLFSKPVPADQAGAFLASKWQAQEGSAHGLAPELQKQTDLLSNDYSM